jgi:copper(I)-binding protein
MSVAIATPHMNRILTCLLLASTVTAAAAQSAPVTAEGAWARASVQGQTATGAFLRLTARERLSLVGVSTPVAGVAEVHEMKLEGNVMRMRPIASLELPAGQPVELKPGGHHLMLMDLKAPLKPDTRVPVTLTFRNAKGEASRLELSVPVLTRAPDGSAPHKH